MALLDSKSIDTITQDDNRNYCDFEKVKFPIKLEARPRADGYSCCFCDSIALPSKVIEDALANSDYKKSLLRYSKWRLDFVQDDTTLLDDAHVAVICVADKILNRGRLTRLSGELESKILDLFNYDKNNFTSREVLNSISNYSCPRIPNEWHDGQKRSYLDNMTVEEYFYKSIFLDVAGIKNARDIIPQVYINSLVDSNERSFVGQRVDFLITHNYRSFVLEIDDNTHADKSLSDAERDKKITANGFEVLRIRDYDLASPNVRLEALKQKLIDVCCDGDDERAGEIRQDCIGIRLALNFQQILVNLLKYGKIKCGESCKIFFDPRNIPHLDSDKCESIIQLALDDLKELFGNLEIIYSIEYSILDGIELSDDNPDLVITINDNYNYDREKIVYLQEVSFPEPIDRDLAFPLIPKIHPLAIGESLEFLLNYIYRFKKFRPNQLEGIASALCGRDTIVLLPTGSGKSLIYQLISLITPGLVIVVDPIIALMDDQLYNLERIGIDRIVALSSETGPKTQQFESALSRGQYIQAYITPERLEIERFRKVLGALCDFNNVSTCAIDEAHCVSEWGHEFRTSYLNIANICRKYLSFRGKAPAILALTGTASEAILRNMEVDLEIPDENVIRPESFDRQEISFVVRAASSGNKRLELRDILLNDLPRKFKMSPNDFYSLSGENTKSGIIFASFVGSSFGVLEILRYVKNLSINCRSYSGPPSDKRSRDDSVRWNDQKRRNAEDFKNNEFPLLVATKAYGMGIDKPNIRYTIHFQPPSSIEEFYQEAGRAGRDRKKSYSYVIFSNDFPNRNYAALRSHSLKGIQELTDAKAEYRDDATRLAYFHKQAFSGVRDELLEAGKIVQEIRPLNDNRTQKLSFEGCDERTKNSKLKSVYRLTLLGIINDYTIDYSKKVITISTGKLDREKVAKCYGAYVRAYQDNDELVRNAEQRIRSFADRDDGEFIKLSLNELLQNFTYKIIESSRRRAMLNLFEMLDRASEIKDEAESSEFIRREVLKFLGNAHVDVIKHIIDAPTDYIFIRNTISGLSKEKCADFHSEISRALESYPNHPGLIIARLQSEIHTYGECANLSNDLLSAFNFYTLDYSQSEDFTKRVLLDTLNLALRSNIQNASSALLNILSNDGVPTDIKNHIIDGIDEKFRYLVLSSKLNNILKEIPLEKGNIWIAMK